MADSYIQVPADGAGKKLDTEELTVSSETVHRERVQIAGSADVEIVIPTDAAPASDDYAVPTRQVGIAAAAALADATSNPTTVAAAALPHLYNGSTWDRQRGDITYGADVDVTRLPAGTNTVGGVTVRPETSGGLTAYKLISGASTNATSVKASAGQLYGWYLSNTNANPRYVKLYNKASAPTVGTDTPVMTLLVPGTGGSNIVSGLGIVFDTGIAFGTTTAPADSDTSVVAVNEIIVNLFYA